ncbi:MAG: hypothetical protein RLZZ524_2190 [Pseudomonadota bacterium]
MPVGPESMLVTPASSPTMRARAVVVDASFVLRYVLHTSAPRPHPEGLALLEDCELLVPPLWQAEIASALVQAERRAVADPARIGQALAVIMALEPDVDLTPVDVARNLELARVHGLSAYDSLYLELAQRRRAALATYDAEMAGAAVRAGITLYPHPMAVPAA